MFAFDFLAKPSGDHGDLHSFPTRRSSDLCGPRDRYAICRPRCSRRAFGSAARSRGARRSRGGSPRERARSEEHTSELQSPYDLVCRLLLEKKKNKQLYSRVNCKTTTT